MSDLFSPYVHEGSLSSYDSSDDKQRITVADYVKSKGGTHAISKILIANNGIAAVVSYNTYNNVDA